MTARNASDELNNGLKNKKRAIVVLQIMLALGTIACGFANLILNHSDIGFTYKETAAKKGTNSYWFDPSNNYVKTTDPPPKDYHRKVFVERLCWDNSAIWGGAIVLMAVIEAGHRAKSDCCTVTLSVIWLVGFLICIATGVIATIWCYQAIPNAMSIKEEYWDKIVYYRRHSRDDYKPTYDLEKSNVYLADVVAAATIATAVLSYVNVILFLVPFILDGLKGLCKLMARSFTPFLCGFQVGIGSCLCRVGSLSSAKDANADKSNSSKYVILKEKTTNDKAALIDETDSTK